MWIFLRLGSFSTFLSSQKTLFQPIDSEHPFGNSGLRFYIFSRFVYGKFIFDYRSNRSGKRHSGKGVGKVWYSFNQNPGHTRPVFRRAGLYILHVHLFQCSRQRLLHVARNKAPTLPLWKWTSPFTDWVICRIFKPQKQSEVTSQAMKAWLRRIINNMKTNAHPTIAPKMKSVSGWYFTEE